MTASTFNGWANWETWNVALWIQNDEGLYNEACRLVRFGRSYQDLVMMLRDCGSKETPTVAAGMTPQSTAWRSMR